ncbi:MAG: penicillin-binding protein 2 [Solitalea-like symbiont of Acarus siro]
MNNPFFTRKYIIQGIIALCVTILISRLAYMQLIDKHYIISSENNVIREVTVFPARGIIYDRNHQTLVENEPVYDLMVVHNKLGKFDIVKLANLLQISPEDLKAKLEKSAAESRYRGVVVEKQIPTEVYAALQEKLFMFPGFYVQNRMLRKYPNKVASHVLGYIGEVNEHDLKNDKYYKQGDYIGVSGIEKSYEEFLRGQKGVKRILVDVIGREKGQFADGDFDEPSISGKTMTTTLDLRLQLLAKELMQNKLGSIVAIEPETGEILAFLSSPDYDPNMLVGRNRGKNYNLLLTSQFNPLFVRPIQAYYPPGSAFKPFTGLVALDMNVINNHTRFACNGGARVGRAFVRCEHRHPPLNIIQAVQKSCNPFFVYSFQHMIDLNTKLSRDEAYTVWYDKMLSFGFSEKLGIDIPNESKGIIPTKDYFNKLYKGSWGASTIISLSIGQGEISLTPLQLVNAAAIIANRGYYYRPHLVKSIGAENYIKQQYKEKIYSDIKPKNFTPIIEGMQLSVDSGTSWRARIPGIEVCGKTGTVQTPHGENHSVFIAFAPKNNPKIAVAVIVENAGYGSTWASPIAGLLIEKYLTNNISKLDEYERVKDAIILPKGTKKQDIEDLQYITSSAPINNLNKNF